MTTKSILIAIACGLVAALAFVSPLSLGLSGMVLSTFTALPLFVSALGFGTIAGAISGGVATAVIAVFFGPLLALAVTVATLGPALIIGHLAGLMRIEDGVEEWYPLSRIMTWLVLISAAIATALLGFSGYSTTSAEQTFLEVMREFAAGFPQENRAALTQEALAAQAKLFAGLMPVVIPASALFVFALNLYLAAKITRVCSWMLRPRDHIPTDAALPVFMTVIFVVSIILSFFGGGFGLGARIIAGASGMGFLMIGLATVHHLTMGMQGRGFMLGVLYALFFAPFVAQIIAFAILLIGVAETLFDLRARRAVKPPST